MSSRAVEQPESSPLAAERLERRSVHASTLGSCHGAEPLLAHIEKRGANQKSARTAAHRPHPAAAAHSPRPPPHSCYDSTHVCSISTTCSCRAFQAGVSLMLEAVLDPEGSYCPGQWITR